MSLTKGQLSASNHNVIGWYPLFRLLFLLGYVGSIFCYQPTVYADELPLCSGYDPLRKSWGFLSVEDQQSEAYCPPGYAVLSHQAVSLAGYRSVSCCPLPEDALTQNHVFTPRTCPSGFVATGIRRTTPTGTHIASNREREIRCTEVNQQQFELIPAEVVEITRLSTPSAESLLAGIRCSARGKLPPNLRYGLGRKSRYTWGEAFCAGLPWGSVLSSFAEKTCRGASFLTLKRRFIRPNDTPNCAAVSGVFSTNSQCLSGPNSETAREYKTPSNSQDTLVKE